MTKWNDDKARAEASRHWALMLENVIIVLAMCGALVSSCWACASAVRREPARTVDHAGGADDV